MSEGRSAAPAGTPTDGSDVRVIPIAEEHIEGYHGAVEAVARESRYLARTEAPPLEDARTFTLENIEKGNAHVVALDGRTVVGWCDIVPSKREAFRHCATLGMGLLAGYRGRGIGTRMLRAALDRAREQGLERVELEVFASNEQAIGLYRKMGFAVEGTRVRAALLRGEYFDVVGMALFLRRPGEAR
jgi:RimJ/RimL family protein N-acetyltransferase